MGGGIKRFLIPLPEKWLKPKPDDGLDRLAFAILCAMQNMALALLCVPYMATRSSSATSGSSTHAATTFAAAYGIKSSFSIALICTISCWIAASL